MNLYQISTLLDNGESGQTWFDVTLAAEDDVVAVRGAFVVLDNLIETLSNVNSTKPYVYVNDDGKSVYRVTVTRAIYATARIDGFGHAVVEKFEQGGYQVAIFDVSIDDSSDVTFQYGHVKTIVGAVNY